MTTVTDNLRIENPCPSILSRMEKTGDNYFCKSCDKTVIDFRQKSSEEIRNSTGKGICGTFTIDQLSGQQKMTFLRRTFFYGLTILSFFGVSVKPLKAQTTIPKTDSVSVDKKTENKDYKQTDKNEDKMVATSPNKRRLFRRKKKQVVTGFF
jgi:hypothetical protein